MITDDYKQIVRENVVNEKGFIKATFSGQQRASSIPWLKVIVRPVLIQGKKHLQFSYFDAHKDITKNYRDAEIVEKLEQLLELTFKDIHIESTRNSVHIAVTKKGKSIVHLKKLSPVDTKEPILSHDRQKKVLLATPDLFQPVLRHSILKERIGDILTDTFRALVLRIMGYQTEVIQFVSSEHTAKNLMIRAVKSYKVGEPKFIQEYKDLKNFWNVTPYLEQLLGDNFTSLL